jgi:hypothetical protein
MADQKNRGGQKAGNLSHQGGPQGHIGAPGTQPEQHQGTNPRSAGGRSDQDKQHDQMTNPDDARRQPTDQKR